MTGHLVPTTLHTNDASSAARASWDIGVERPAIATPAASSRSARAPRVPADPVPSASRFQRGRACRCRASAASSPAGACALAARAALQQRLSAPAGYVARDPRYHARAARLTITNGATGSGDLRGRRARTQHAHLRMSMLEHGVLPRDSTTLAGKSERVVVHAGTDDASAHPAADHVRRARSRCGPLAHGTARASSWTTTGDRKVARRLLALRAGYDRSSKRPRARTRSRRARDDGRTHRAHRARPGPARHPGRGRCKDVGVGIHRVAAGHLCSTGSIDPRPRSAPHGRAPDYIRKPIEAKRFVTRVKGPVLRGRRGSRR